MALSMKWARSEAYSGALISGSTSTKAPRSPNSVRCVLTW